MKPLFIPLFSFCLLLLTSCNEIAQWRGPNRDGIYPDKNLLKKWPENGPKLKLQIDNVGKGLSQPVIYDNKIYITGIKHDSLDVLSSYDLDGNMIFEKVYSKAWNRTYPESRATPTIENDKVYLIGGLGNLICIEAKTGNVIWVKKPLEEFQGEYKIWGIVESVLLTDKAALYITAGEETTVVAYDKENGDFLWKTESLGGAKSYASSSMVEWGGIKIALVQTTHDFIGVNVDDGEILWSYNTIQYHTKKGKGEAANTPLFHEGDIFITYGNDQPGMLFSLSHDAKSIIPKWSNNILDTHFGGLVLLNGVIYGSTMRDNKRGNWAAVDWKTGKTFWETEWHTKGAIISADGMLYLYEEQHGNVALVKPNKEKLEVISSFQVPKGQGPHWAHPSIYKGMLMIRHRDKLMIYDLKR